MHQIRPADPTTRRRPKGGKYFGAVAGPVHLDQLAQLVVCPLCGRGISKAARYCDRCTKAAAL